MDGQGRLDAQCCWCELPATRDLTVDVKGSMPKVLPVCDDHAAIASRPVVKPPPVKRGTGQASMFELASDGPTDALTGG